MMIKVYKFKVYPNKKQEELIQKTFGCVRYIYNYYLDKGIKNYQDSKKFISFAENSRDLTILKQENKWLQEVDKWSLQNSLKNLDSAYVRFFNGQNNFPNF